jgi:hypothetical protein
MRLLCGLAATCNKAPLGADERGFYSNFSEEDRQRWRDLGIRFWDVEISSKKWTCFAPKWGEPEVFEFQAARDFGIFYRNSKGKCGLAAALSNYPNRSRWHRTDTRVRDQAP